MPRNNNRGRGLRERPARREPRDRLPERDGRYEVQRDQVSSHVRRCPGCDHFINPGTLHVVAWRQTESAQERRHWHTSCFDKRRDRQPIDDV